MRPEPEQKNFGLQSLWEGLYTIMYEVEGAMGILSWGYKIVGMLTKNQRRFMELNEEN